MKGILVEMAFKRALPSDISGGGGEVLMSVWAQSWTLFLRAVFSSFFE